MQKLSEINIRPLRIAFDHYAQRDVYIEAVTKAAESGIMEAHVLHVVNKTLLIRLLEVFQQFYHRVLPSS